MVFGANEYWKKMFKMLEKKYPLPCPGTNTFQVIYVKELARAIGKVLEKGKNGEIYLASGREKKTLNEFCEIAQKEMGLKQGIKHVPTALGVIAGKIEKLGWKQQTTLEKAMKEVIKELEIK